jgi:hypothetical protein
LKRQLSLPVSTMSQWWVKRSSSAVVILASPNTLGHSPKARMVVTMADVRSVRQLEADIRAFIDRHNQNPRPFKWTKSADQILASVKRFSHKAQQTLCSEL